MGGAGGRRLVSGRSRVEEVTGLMDVSAVTHGHISGRYNVKEVTGMMDVSLVTHGYPSYAYPIISDTKR
jgi:hypothetical protein